LLLLLLLLFYVVVALPSVVVVTFTLRYVVVVVTFVDLRCVVTVDCYVVVDARCRCCYVVVVDCC